MRQGALFAGSFLERLSDLQRLSSIGLFGRDAPLPAGVIAETRTEISGTRMPPDTGHTE